MDDPFSRWASSEDEEVLVGCFSRIPDRVDILVAHSPPYGWHDRKVADEHRGSQALLAARNRSGRGCWSAATSTLPAAPWGRSNASRQWMTAETRTRPHSDDPVEAAAIADARELAAGTIASALAAQLNAATARERTRCDNSAKYLAEAV